jgi:hypothetical protein
VALTHFSLTIVWPDGGFCPASVVVVPADAAAVISRSVVFHVGPNVSGLFTRLDPTVSPCGRFVLPLRAFLCLLIMASAHDRVPFSFSYNASSG